LDLLFWSQEREAIFISLRRGRPVIHKSSPQIVCKRPVNPRMHNRAAQVARSGARKENPWFSWAALLDEAVRKPGYIHEAYSRFHNYSLGNQLLALFQCFERGIQPGPLATFPVEGTGPLCQKGCEGPARHSHLNTAKAGQTLAERKRCRQKARLSRSFTASYSPIWFRLKSASWS